MGMVLALATGEYDTAGAILRCALCTCNILPPFAGFWRFHGSSATCYLQALRSSTVVAELSKRSPAACVGTTPTHGPGCLSLSSAKAVHTSSPTVHVHHFACPPLREPTTSHKCARQLLPAPSSNRRLAEHRIVLKVVGIGQGKAPALVGKLTLTPVNIVPTYRTRTTSRMYQPTEHVIRKLCSWILQYMYHNLALRSDQGRGLGSNPQAVTGTVAWSGSHGNAREQIETRWFYEPGHETQSACNDGIPCFSRGLHLVSHSMTDSDRFKTCQRCAQRVTLPHVRRTTYLVCTQPLQYQGIYLYRWR